MTRLRLLAVLFTLGMASPAWADSSPSVVSASTNAVRTRTVFNNTGSAVTSGSVVIWDNDGVNGSSTAFDRSGYPYVTTTTAADSPWVAGVTLTPTCNDQDLCEIVVEGPAITRIAQTADAIAEDTAVSTTTVAGQAGDYGPAANTCLLGMSMELRANDTGATSGLTNNTLMWIYVHPSCQ